ncbi:hypothetical protein T440DRAFT_492050 [Plenodomus tracheiphilus IPT5]|uniref:Helicase ATP-binding domain-containing protein n=1 Tax=Plenodomus tracheiphilus IPT5 TaxID=1408161 RepID=A0A6A7AYV2_9PLEO|nr:hypothetical protein T440DRAFT_492050 [Plenodomus tracheiphilus IPT5]
MVMFDNGPALGEINKQLETALQNITEQRHYLEIEVFAPIKAIQDTIGRVQKENDAIVRVQVYIYGSREAAQEIGNELSQLKLFLQKALHVRDGCFYENPQNLPLVGYHYSRPEASDQAAEAELAKATLESLDRTVTQVFSSLTRGEKLRGLEGDNRLKTTLLLHQKKALGFMTEREDGPIPHEYQLWIPTESDGVSSYRHAVTNTRCMYAQTETGGGILADEMGMGKTLSILALSVMINEWFQELEKHFDRPTRDALTALKYHGKNRQFSIDQLCEADIIITTYYTLASDFAGPSHPLRELQWYRLVLDEAHIIRRQSTLLYRTVADIAARSRWCLTGTPIQNRLEDIGSLFAFLRISPFHNLSVFRKYIALPFEENGRRRELAIQRFAKLLDSLCLRQTKDLLHLPDQLNRTRIIELSEEERFQYNQTNKTMFRAISNQNGLTDQKSTLGMFQVQLQLRIICNHGTWQQPFSWSRYKLHLLDEREAMEASLGRNGEVTCSACGQPMSLFSTSILYKRYTEHCRHILCLDCLSRTATSAEDAFPVHCPLCAPLWKVSMQAAGLEQASQEDLYFRPDGYSSKMEALMNDVLTEITSTKR